MFFFPLHGSTTHRKCVVCNDRHWLACGVRSIEWFVRYATNDCFFIVSSCPTSSRISITHFDCSNSVKLHFSRGQSWSVIREISFETIRFSRLGNSNQLHRPKELSFCLSTLLSCTSSAI